MSLFSLTIIDICQHICRHGFILIRSTKERNIWWKQILKLTSRQHHTGDDEWLINVCVCVFTVDDKIFFLLRNSNNRNSKLLKEKKYRWKDYSLFSLLWTHNYLPCWFILMIDLEPCLNIWFTRFLQRCIQDDSVNIGWLNVLMVDESCCSRFVLREQFVTIIECVCFLLVVWKSTYAKEWENEVLY